ncbi:PKD domain-containing protein [Sphingobacterium luzhongxinii]|uniref:PKD domain-containing protein n=1 Tax=Sphingobacterium luzhongxinii TaxID=2654181 RepID=UPI0013D90BDD|nr:hypothetical protein [Sphingobacterium sp. xlx-73]
MRKIELLRPLFLLLMPILLWQACVKKEQDIKVSIDFATFYESSNQTVPARVRIENHTRGAETYRWTFEGGQPAVSDRRDPGVIVYEQAGEYRIILEASNPEHEERKEITIRIDSAVRIAFDLDTVINVYAPAEFVVRNQTDGASSYKWNFHGAAPSGSTARDPGTIRYDVPGDYTVALEVTNGSRTYKLDRHITVLPTLEADFEILPMLGDEDYEAPFTALLKASGTSVHHYNWTAPGGQLQHADQKEAQLYIERPGRYAITLVADNGKTKKIITKDITITANSNLYHFSNIKLGINSAHATIGSFYSTRLQRVFAAGEVTPQQGNLIDIVFFGINNTFTQNRFVSPDQAGDLTFQDIPGAGRTRWINQPQGVGTSDALFESMQDDSWLRTVDIGAGDQKPIYFDLQTVPHFALFQHANGYKGIVRVRSVHRAGPTDSYIVVDIKVQKQ